MSLLLEPRAPAASPLSARALAHLARAVALRAPTTILPAGDHRRWALVEETSTYQAWMIAWPAGTGLELHDHDESAAGVYMVAGRLQERFLGIDGRLHPRVWTPGSTYELAADHVHEVVNAGEHEAISVHVYSPRLRDVRFRTEAAVG